MLNKLILAKKIRIGALALLGLAATLAGCAESGNWASASGSDSVNSAVAATAAATLPGFHQQSFDTDDAAGAALLNALKANDQDTMHQLFGPALQELLSGDKVEDAKAFQAFAAHAQEKTTLDKKDPNTTILDIGNDQWPFPIPIVRGHDGKWFFDTEAGKQEILARRIGKNELETIRVCRSYVEAQREYASADRDGSGVFKYAQRFISSPEKMDGLYWPVAAGEPQSPLGPLVAEAEDEGYPAPGTAGPDTGHHHQPYFGYYFHILKAQGSDAPGGAYNYVINQNMIAGFGLIACPDKYGSSGIMTFIISHQGKLYQKDLGLDTLKIVHKMKAYDPDSTWTLVKD